MVEKDSRVTPGLALGVIWFAWLIVFALLGLLGTDNQLSVYLLLAHVLVVLACALTVKHDCGVALALGLVFRLILMYVDLDTDIQLFASGGDTENFYNTAVMIYESPGLLAEDLYGGIYPKFCALIFGIIGPSRLFIQYLNVLFSVSSLALISMTMERLGVSVHVRRRMVLIVALMPINASISAIFLREAVVGFLVSLSVYSFARWITGGRVTGLLLSFSFALLGSAFHLGVIGLLVGYIAAVLAYDRALGRVRWTLDGLIKAAALVVVVGVLAFRNAGFFLEKLERATSAESLFKVASAADAGSAYLTDVQVDSVSGFVLWSIPKGVMLLVAPIPGQWRGAGDVAAFALDGILFLVAMLIVAQSLRKRTSGVRQWSFLVFLTCGLISAVLLLGIGTSTAGTALRHRQKLVPIMSVMVALALTRFTGGDYAARRFGGRSNRSRSVDRSGGA